MFRSHSHSPNWLNTRKEEYVDHREIPDSMYWSEWEKARQKRDDEEEAVRQLRTEYTHEFNTLYHTIDTLQDIFLTHSFCQVENILFGILQDDVLNNFKNEFKPTLTCIEFLQSATNLINTCRNKEVENYETKVTTAREKFADKTNELEKYLSPTCCDRFRGIVSMFFGTLIKIATLGCASSATAREGYHLFFGKGKAPLTTFKNQLLHDTKSNRPNIQT